jgi:hypothetical protein
MEVVEIEADHVAGAPAVPGSTRNTTKYMTKYERARVTGTRALQIRCVFSVRGGFVIFPLRYLLTFSLIRLAAWVHR